MRSIINNIIEFIYEYMKTGYLDTFTIESLPLYYKNILKKHIPNISNFLDELKFLYKE